MTRSDASDSEIKNEAKLPRRDWILLPAIGLLTILLLLASSELVASRMFRSTPTGVGSCIVQNDKTGTVGIPNSVCRDKLPEGNLVEYRFNSCGDRSDLDCKAKTPGTYRIVMTGTSFAMGLNVSYPDSFAALLPVELSHSTGQKIELYNQGNELGSIQNVILRLNDSLAAKPDLVLWIVTPYDMYHMFHQDLQPERVPGFLGATRYRIKQAIATEPPIDAASDVLATLSSLYATRASTSMLVRHYFYESQSESIKIAERDDVANGFLKADYDAEWQRRLLEFDRDDLEIESRTAAAGVPLVVSFIPNRLDAALLSAGKWPQGYDPYKLDHELRAIVQRHGGIFIDISASFSNIPNAEQYFLPIDGHLDARGNAIIAGLMAKALIGGNVPGLRIQSQTQADPREAR
jgi:hypothetical protein